LRANNHTNPELQYDFNLYGEDKFHFFCIGEFQTYQQANEAEIELLKSSEPYAVYNLDHTGKPSSKVGVPKTDEHKAKMSEGAKRRWERERLARAS